MRMTLQFETGHEFEILVCALVDAKGLTFKATLEESQFLSFFDSRELYTANTIEEVIKKISIGIKAAIDESLNY